MFAQKMIKTETEKEKSYTVKPLKAALRKDYQMMRTHYQMLRTDYQTLRMN